MEPGASLNNNWTFHVLLYYRAALSMVVYQYMYVYLSACHISLLLLFLVTSSARLCSNTDEGFFIFIKIIYLYTLLKIGAVSLNVLLG